MADNETPSSSDAPASPYLTARREWNERYGSHIQGERYWRRMAFASAAIAALAVGGVVYMASKSSVAPYAVEISGNSEVVRVVRADLMQRPNTDQVRAALRQWVIGARTIYTDPQALRSAIEQTYAMTAANSEATAALSSYKTNENPFVLARQKTVTIDVNAIVPVSDTSWHAEWTERTTLPDGKETEQQWQATLTIKIAPPKTESALMVNPLGIFVTNFAWTQRL